MDQSINLVTHCASLTLSTVSQNGEPHCSYAPFVRPDGDGFYIFISELAKHTESLTHNGTAGVLIIEDEAEASDIFARRRISLTCSAKFISREAPNWIAIVDQLQARHGDTVALLRELPDFSLVRLVPSAGTLVTGFAKATELTSENSALLQVTMN